MRIACHIAPWGERFTDGQEAIRDSGYGAIESYCLSQWFAKPDAYRDALREAGLELAAMEYGGDWIDPARVETEKQGAELLAGFLAVVGAGIMVVSGGPRPAEGAPLASYDDFTDVMTRLGIDCRDRGVRLCHHPKPCTLIEYRDQIERFMAATDPDAVSLCLDTGDLASAGCDPLEVARSLGNRVGHVHLKDLDWRTHGPVPPGKGALDLRGVLDALRERGYDGWVTVELDRSADPLEAARASRAFVEAAMGR